jgi:hypothetical protein
MGKEVYKMSDRMKVMMNMFRKTKRRNHRMAAMMVGGIGIVAAMATTAAFMVKKKKKMKHDQPQKQCDFDSSSEDDNYQI